MVYEILSKDVYRGQASVSPAKISLTIPPEKISSMTGLKPSVSSYGHAPQSHYFAKYGVITRTANNTFVTSYEDYLKNGYFSQRDDSEINGMRHAGEDVKPVMFNVIPEMLNVAYITGITPLPMRFPNKRDTPVRLYTTPRIVEAVEPNKTGYSESKNANRYQELRDSLFEWKTNGLQDEAVAQVEFLGKRLSLKTENPVLGLGMEKGDFMAAYHPEKGYLVTEFNFHNRAQNLVSKYLPNSRDALALGAFKRSIQAYHEADRHGAFGIPGDRKSEKLQGLLDAEFYSMMAELHKGTKMEKIYRALAREGMDYAREFSKSKLLEEITADLSPKEEKSIDLLVAKFEAEANALELKEKEKGVYINKRLEETYGKLLKGEPSYEGKGLERLAKNDKFAFAEKGEDGLLTYNGRRAYTDGISAEDYKNTGNNERRIAPSEHKSMSDAKSNNAKAGISEKAEAEAASSD